MFWLHVHGLKWFDDISRGWRRSGDDRRLSRRHVHSLPSVTLWLLVDGLPLIHESEVGIDISISIGITIPIAVGIHIGDAISIRSRGVIRTLIRIVTRTSSRTLFRMSKSHVKILLIFFIEDLRASTHSTSVFALPTWILSR